MQYPRVPPYFEPLTSEPLLFLEQTNLYTTDQLLPLTSVQ